MTCRLRVWHQLQPCIARPAGDLAKVMCVVWTISNLPAIAEAPSRFDHKSDLLYSTRTFVHWYGGDGMRKASSLKLGMGYPPADGGTTAVIGFVRSSLLPFCGVGSRLVHMFSSQAFLRG